METFMVLGLLGSTFAMVFSKRISALIGNFALQSFFLCLFSFMEALKGNHLGLYIIAGLILLLKVILIPQILRYVAVNIKSDENLGFFISPQLSLVCALVLTYLAWLLASTVFMGQPILIKIFGATAFSMVSLGVFLMIFRIIALAQVIGLLAMENGIFLLASAVSGGMPFIVEMAIFFDIFVGVVILGIFIYRINKLFVGIDVSKLNSLKG